MNKKTYKVLSIDGGGIKGLYSALILQYIEKAYSINLHNYFDMFCGTSTGGIIALALASNIPIEEVIKFYKNRGPEIFPYKRLPFRLLGGIKQVAIAGKYSNCKLEEALKAVFKDKKVGDLQKEICVPALRLSNNRLTIFKRDHSSNHNMHNEIPIYKIALATSAAPTYFPIVKVDEAANGYYVDGGLVANDPSVIGAIETSKYFVGEDRQYKKFDMLSISSIDTCHGLSSVMSKRRLSILWALNIIELIMSAQSNANFFNMKHLKDILPCENYIKIHSPQLSGNQSKCIKLDLASKKAIETIEELAHDVWTNYKNTDKLNSFFND